MFGPQCIGRASASRRIGQGAIVGESRSAIVMQCSNYAR